MIVPEAYLHAYVDGELTAEEFDRVATEILNSHEQSIRACDFLALKHLIRQAYKTIPVSDDS